VNHVTRLLHISSSPRGEASVSLALADEFFATYQATHPDHVVDTWDLWDGTLPVFGRDAAAAKLAVLGGQEPASHEAQAWSDTLAAVDRFLAADAYVFSVPMWNSTVPYVLKQFIDVVSQPNRVFRFDPESGYTGLVTGRKAAALYTGAIWSPDFPPAFGDNFLEPYFESWLRWTGVTDIASVSLLPNFLVANPDAALEAAKGDVRALASTF
jgi:FMN-dependent NADH-azoreductase